MDEVVLGIVCRRGRALLVKRRKDDDFVWSFPGGKIGADETKEYAIIRAIRRETNVDCVAKRELGQRVHPSTERLVSYWQCVYHSGVPRPSYETIEDVEWVTYEEALERLGETLFEPAKTFLETATRGI